MPTEDYRDSHKVKGDHYDQTIGSAPLDTYMDKWEGHHLARALGRFFPTGIPRYLDFACGTGRITERVAPSARESVGVDISESMLAVARRKCPKTRFVCADLTRDDVDLGLFDLVTSFRFFGNAQDELRSSVLASINRRLRPSGYLIINSHRNPRSLLGISTRSTPEGAAMDLTRAKLGKLLGRHGFEIVSERPIGFWIYRFKLTTAETLESARADKLERAFQHSWLARFSPDALIVARKIGVGTSG
jgi:ubiquinone/menaquinone biosynthesis C-methylase UbiE